MVVAGGTAGAATAGRGTAIVLVTCATAAAGTTGIATTTGRGTAAAIGAASYIIGTVATSLCNSVSAKSAARVADGELIYIYIYGF